MNRWLFLLLALTFGACQTMRYEESYIRAAFQVIAEHSLHKYEVDIPNLEEQAVAELTDTSTTLHCHDIIRRYLQDLDHHSNVYAPVRFEEWVTPINSEDVDTQYPFFGYVNYDQVAYVKLDGFNQGDSISTKLFADSLRNLVIDLHARNPHGWVVDLRDNSGGNPYAMFAGLGPLMGKGDCGYSVTPDQDTTAYYAFRDHPETGELDYITLVDEPFGFDDGKPLAVITGSNTASAGEMLTIGFKRLPHCKTFGEGTYGSSTSNLSCSLEDGALLIITSGIMTGIDGTVYGSIIDPDEYVEDSAGNDKALRTASGWVVSESSSE